MGIIKDYDVFVAYLGSDEETTASYLYAEAVANHLKNSKYLIGGSEANLDVAFFSNKKNAGESFKATPYWVMLSRIFLLVCNSNVKESDLKKHTELKKEIDSFWALCVDDDSKQKNYHAEILYCGKKKNKEDKAITNIHPIFKDRTCSIYIEEDKFNKYLEGLKNNPDSSKEAEKELFKNLDEWIIKELTAIYVDENLIESDEIKKVYSSRSKMMQDIDFKSMISHAKIIRALGMGQDDISSSLLKKNMEDCIIKNGGDVEILFLNPNSEYAKERGELEAKKVGFWKDDIISNICLNIMKAAIVKHSLEDKSDKFRLYEYDMIPRMNMIIIDDTVLLNYYSNSEAGLSNPAFLIKKRKGSSPIYDYCWENYMAARENAELIPYTKYKEVLYQSLENQEKKEDVFFAKDKKIEEKIQKQMQKKKTKSAAAKSSGAAKKKSASNEAVKSKRNKTSAAKTTESKKTEKKTVKSKKVKK